MPTGRAFKRRHSARRRLASGRPSYEPLDLESLFKRTVRRLAREGEIEPEQATTEILSEAFQSSIADLAAGLAESLRRRRAETVGAEDATRLGFEERLRDIWGEAIDCLHAVIVAAREAGAGVARAGAAEDERRSRVDVQRQAIVLLHSRACLVASEVIELLRAGFASGAHARWRTLHEIAVIAEFLREQDVETAERYLAHGDVTRAANLEAYQAHAATLGEAPFPTAEAAAIKATRDAIVAKYEGAGIDFDSPYGWAAKALRVKAPRLHHIEAAVKLEHWQVHRHMANFSSHGGAAGSTFDLGNDDPRLMTLAGASNSGLADPGSSAAISLGIATSALLGLRPTGYRASVMLAIQDLVRDTIDAFDAGEGEYERSKRRLRRSDPGWRRRLRRP